MKKVILLFLLIFLNLNLIIAQSKLIEVISNKFSYYEDSIKKNNGLKIYYFPKNQNSKEFYAFYYFGKKLIYLYFKKSKFLTKKVFTEKKIIATDSIQNSIWVFSELSIENIAFFHKACHGHITILIPLGKDFFKRVRQEKGYFYLKKYSEKGKKSDWTYITMKEAYSCISCFQRTYKFRQDLNNFIKFIK